MTKKPTDLDRMLSTEPDLVDRIFDYIFSDPALANALKGMQAEAIPVAGIKAAVRAEFRGEACYIAGSRVSTADVLALFNGRNATEVARRLGISRSSVYRHLKQPGGKTKNSPKFPGNETAGPLL